MGSLYKRGQVWWLQYYREGKPIRESAQTQDKTEARRVLKQREGQVAQGELPPRPGKATWREASVELLAYYRAYGSRDPEEAGYRLKHLDQYFQGHKLSEIDPAASEVLTLTKPQVDLEAGTLRLEPGTTKNDEGRVVYLTAELTSLLAAQLERVRGLERKTGHIIPFPFPNLKGPSKGKRRRDFPKAWMTACLKAGCPGMVKHDLWRTAVRNIVNLGVPERVAMQVTGHKTRSIFDRYHVMSPGDLQDVARRLSDVPPTISRYNASVSVPEAIVSY